jgi:transcriptional regulator with XRE-family HTH domain
MSELAEKLGPEFQDKEYRDAYAEECLNAMIASQIRALREQRQMTQQQLADATGMGQPRIPVLEDSSYENWSVNTLRRFARAFDVALSVKFETFSDFIQDFEVMSRESLQRPTFAEDLQLQRKRRYTHGHKRRRSMLRYKRKKARFPVEKNAIGGAARKGPARVLQAYEYVPTSNLGSQRRAMGDAR